MTHKTTNSPSIILAIISTIEVLQIIVAAFLLLLGFLGFWGSSLGMSLSLMVIKLGVFFDVLGYVAIQSTKNEEQERIVLAKRLVLYSFLSKALAMLIPFLFFYLFNR